MKHENIKKQWLGKDRRKIRRIQDNFYRLLSWLNGLGWILFIAVVYLSHYARPEFESGLDRYFGLEVRDYWDPDYTRTILVLLLCCIGLSMAVLLLKLRRNRRKNDKYSPFGFGLLILALVTLVMILVGVRT
jgi:hypothetical protein